MARLGQHFLIDKNIISQIVGAIDVQPSDAIIEIGPGHGEMTEAIREKNNNVKIIVIEKDEFLASTLENHFKKDANFSLLKGDALKILPAAIAKLREEAKNKNIKIVGNIPYYITGHLFRIISELEIYPTMCVFMIQKEVAIRAVATPPQMNRLAASLQFWADVKIIALVNKKYFKPEPMVDSAVIYFKTKEKKEIIDKEKYYSVVRKVFSQPRKTIANNMIGIKDLKKEEVVGFLKKIKISPEVRPQNLEIGQIIKIATEI